MAWPKQLEFVQCDGFSKKLLSSIRQALENDLVLWDKSETQVLGAFARGRFEFADCTWQLEENFEEVYLIKLINGTVDEESIICALLRG